MVRGRPGDDAASHEILVLMWGFSVQGNMVHSRPVETPEAVLRPELAPVPFLLLEGRDDSARYSLGVTGLPGVGYTKTMSENYRRGTTRHETHR